MLINTRCQFHLVLGIDRSLIIVVVSTLLAATTQMLVVVIGKTHRLHFVLILILALGLTNQAPLMA